MVIHNKLPITINLERYPSKNKKRLARYPQSHYANTYTYYSLVDIKLRLSDLTTNIAYLHTFLKCCAIPTYLNNNVLEHIDKRPAINYNKWIISGIKTITSKLATILVGHTSLPTFHNCSINQNN